MGNKQFIEFKIVDAIDWVEPNGLLFVESSFFLEIIVDVEEGTKIDRRYISPWFVTYLEKLIVELENAKVLDIKQKISMIKSIILLLEKIIESSSVYDC